MIKILKRLNPFFSKKQHSKLFYCSNLKDKQQFLKQLKRQKAQLAYKIINIIAYNSQSPPNHSFDDEIQNKNTTNLQEKANKTSQTMKQKQCQQYIQQIEEEEQNLQFLQDQKLQADIQIKQINSKSREQFLKMKYLPFTKRSNCLHYQSYNYNNQVKRQFLKFFNQGINLDKTIFEQERVSKLFAGNKQKKITFFPTDLTTRTVFKHIISCIGSNWMQGHMGLSKTFSLILYSLLSNYVVAFKVSHKQDPQAIKMKIVKTVYWTIQVDNFSYDKLFDIILLQCPQIKELISPYKNNVDKKKIEIEMAKIYKEYNIKTVILIDQINVLVRQFIKQYGHQLKEFTSDSILLTDNQKRKKLKQIKAAILLLKYKFRNLLQLSSISAEYSVLRKLNLTGQETHTNIIILDINYGQLLYKKETVFAILDYFLFQFGDKIVIDEQIKDWHLKVNQNNLLFKNQLKYYLYEKIQSKYGNTFYLTPLVINKSIRSFINNTDYNKLFTNEQNLNITEKFKFLTYLMLERSISSTYINLEQKIKQFVKKSQEDIRIWLLMFMYLKANQIGQTNKNQKQKFECPILSFSQLKDISIQDKLFEHIDRHLFEINNQNRQIKMNFPATIVQQVLKRFYKLFAQFRKKNNVWENMDDQTFGRQFQTALLNSFVIGNIQLIFLQANKPIIIYYLMSKKVYGFIPFPGEINKFDLQFANYQNYSFIDGIIPSLEQISLLMQTQFLCLPIKVNKIKKIQKQKFDKMKQNQKRQYLIDLNRRLLQPILDSPTGMIVNQRSSTSKSIDFIIIKKEPKNQITLSVFDIKTTDDKISDYMKTFLLISSIMNDQNRTQITLNKQKYEIKMQYFIIAPNKKTIQWPKICNQVYFLYQKHTNKVPQFDYVMQSKSSYNVQPKQNSNKKFLMKRFGVISIDQGMKIINYNTPEMILSSNQWGQIIKARQQMSKKIAKIT